MNGTIQETLLNLFQQVSHAPESIPTLPINAWQENSEERALLVGFRDMLEHIQQSRQQGERQLREREEQYRAIFEATTDTLVIARLDNGQIVEVNPAACKMLGYSYEELIGLPPNILTPPAYLPTIAESLQKVMEGEQINLMMESLRKDGTSFPIEVYGTRFTFRGEPHLLSVTRDITERLEAERQLREREEQYHSVFEATYDALFIMDLNGFLLEVNPAFCSVFGYSYEELIGLHASVLTAPTSLPVLDESIEILKVGMTHQAELQELRQARRKDGTLFYADAHSTPITYRGQPHALGVVRDTTEQVQAQQLLEQRVKERTRELSTLLEVSHNVTSTLELSSLLGLILEQLKVVADYDGVTITRVEDEHLVIVDYRGPSREQLLGWRFPLERFGLIYEMISCHEAVILEDVTAETPLTLAYQCAIGELHRATSISTRAWMAIPMVFKEDVMGVLLFFSHEPGFFTARHAALAMGIANQAAIAIENARLYAQAQKLAALEERQKLARELHDSVSQALYGISLGAHAARTALAHDPEHVGESLDYVLSLAEAGLAEMRALIFELRPESLATEGLVSALAKQAAALQARHELAVATELGEEPTLALRAKQDLYRIAQEAMHNVAKHAHASHVLLRLDQIAGEVLLEVRDDGTGFDTTASFPGHLGLHSMRERVANWGGTVAIESEPGKGTQIRARVPTSP